MPESETATLRHTALFDLHERQGGRIVPFAGWAMPVQYKGIVDEHNAVRQRAGVFDVSHMGRLFVVGPDAGRLLRSALTYNVAKIAEGRGHYTLLCNEQGGIIDDPYVYRLDEERLLFVGNASNADRDTERVRVGDEVGGRPEVDAARRREQLPARSRGVHRRGRRPDADGGNKGEQRCSDSQARIMARSTRVCKLRADPGRRRRLEAGVRPHHPHPSRGRSRREARLPAG